MDSLSKRSGTFGRPIAGARWIASSIVALAACQWNERWGRDGRLVFSADGVVSTLDLPGPDPSGVSGIRKDYPPITEDNMVDVSRVTGRVQVRQPGDRGFETLEYFRPKIQSGPGGVLVTYTNTTAQLVFHDDSRVVLHESAMATFGDPAKNEPWLVIDRMNSLELTCSANASFGGIQLPGGPVLHSTSEGRVRVLLQRDRYLQIRNEGKVPVELTYRGRSVWLRTADWMDLPILRNAPPRPDLIEAAEAHLPPGTAGRPFRLGEARFPSADVQFEPMIPKRMPAGSQGGRRSSDEPAQRSS